MKDADAEEPNSSTERKRKASSNFKIPFSIYKHFRRNTMLRRRERRRESSKSSPNPRKLTTVVTCYCYTILKRHKIKFYCHKNGSFTSK